MTLREIDRVLRGRVQAIKDDQALAYYQAYLSGLFSQPYAKGKFPRYETHAPWRTLSRRASSPDYDRNLERMFLLLTQAQGGKVH